MFGGLSKSWGDFEHSVVADEGGCVVCCVLQHFFSVDGSENLFGPSVAGTDFYSVVLVLERTRRFLRGRVVTTRSKNKHSPFSS